MFKRGYFFAGLSVAALVVACGSSDSSSGSGSAPDFNTLETELTVPTGTMAAGEEAAVGDGLGAKQEQASGNPFGGIGGSSLKPQASCDTIGQDGTATGTCDCPGGGSVTYDLSGLQSQQNAQDGNIDFTLSYSADSCVSDGNTMNGSVYIKEKGNTKDYANLLIIYALHMTISGTKNATYDVDYLYKNGKIVFKIDVKDGSVLVSGSGNWDKTTKTGEFTVTDKNETWTCKATNGVGTCTSDKGGTRDFK